MTSLFKKNSYFFIRFRQSLECSVIWVAMLMVKMVLKIMQARRGFFRPKDLSSETMQADFMSKSSSFLSSMNFFIYPISFCSSQLSNSNVFTSKSYFADFYFSSSFLVFFVCWCASFAYSTFSYFFSFLPVAMFLGAGGFFSMYAVSLCLLSNYPVNGQESHLPVIMLLMTIMCISGSLHLGQQIYFSINLSKTFNISPSVNYPLIMQFVLFLPPAYLNVV